MNLNIGNDARQDALLNGSQPPELRLVPPSLQRRWVQAIAMLLWSLGTISRAGLPMPDADFHPVMIVSLTEKTRVLSSLALQADGKILIGGSFISLDGQPRGNLGRLNRDGTPDPTFSPGANFDVTALALQPDGKVLVGGYFTMLDGQPRKRLGRLNPHGTLDPTFDSPLISAFEVFSLTLQPDGKILAAGRLLRLDGKHRFPLLRFNADGTLDPAFILADLGGTYDAVSSVALQADRKILVGGSFTTLGGQPRKNLARLNPDGTLDSTFNPGAGAGSSVESLAVQADGKILVAGRLTTLGGQPRNNLGRLNPDGTLDPTFNPGADSAVFTVALQADGRILVSGFFHTLGGQPRDLIGRLNPDGTVDATFDPGADHGGHSLTVQADGKILVVKFGLSGRLIGRLNNTGPATQALAHDGSTITWMRGGTSPEVWRTTFESSADGLNWTFPGAGKRIPGGWELAGFSIPPGTILRARGYAAGGSDSSGWFAETMWMAPPASIGLERVNGGVDITVSSVTGLDYTLQTSATLDAWVDVPGAIAVNGTGTALVLRHATPGPRRSFYRVVARSAP